MLSRVYLLLNALLIAAILSVASADSPLVRKSNSPSADVPSSRIIVEPEYLTPFEPTDFTLQVFDEAGDEIDVSEGIILWESPSGKLTFSNQKGSRVTVTPNKQDGLALDLTRVVANVTLGEKKYSVSEYKMIYRPWGEDITRQTKRRHEIAPPIPTDTDKDDDEFDWPFDSTTPMPECPLSLTPRTWFRDEKWLVNGEWYWPPVPMMGRDVEHRVVYEERFHYAVDLTYFDYDSCKIFTRHWIYRMDMYCNPILDYGLEEVEQHWCDCAEPFYIRLIRTFFANVERMTIENYFILTYYSRGDVDEWPEYTEWRFDRWGAKPEGCTMIFMCSYPNDDSHNVITGSCAL